MRVRNSSLWIGATGIGGFGVWLLGLWLEQMFPSFPDFLQAVTGTLGIILILVALILGAAAFLPEEALPNGPVVTSLRRWIKGASPDEVDHRLRQIPPQDRPAIVSIDGHGNVFADITTDGGGVYLHGEKESTVTNINISSTNQSGGITAHTVHHGPPPPTVEIGHTSTDRMPDGRWRHEWAVKLECAFPVSRLTGLVWATLDSRGAIGDGIQLLPAEGGVSFGGNNVTAMPAFAYTQNATRGLYKLLAFTADEPSPRVEVKIT